MEFFLVALTDLAVLIGAQCSPVVSGLLHLVLLLGAGIAASLIPAIPDLVLEPEWILSGILSQAQRLLDVEERRLDWAAG